MLKLIGKMRRAAGGSQERGTLAFGRFKSLLRRSAVDADRHQGTEPEGRQAVRSECDYEKSFRQVPKARRTSGRGEVTEQAVGALLPVRHLYCSSIQDEHMTYHNWARQCPTA